MERVVSKKERTKTKAVDVVLLVMVALGIYACTMDLSTGTGEGEGNTDPVQTIEYGDTTIVSNSTELAKAFDEARSGGGDHLILLKDGVYQQSKLFVIDQPKIALKGESGNRDKVILRGSTQMHCFLVRESYFSLENMTIGSAPDAPYGFVPNHIIQVQGERDADHFTLRNCRLIDAFEQMLKVSKSSSDVTSSDSGLVEDCLFEFTTGHGLQWYTGGIDAHRANDWIVRNNTFKNIYNPDPVNGNSNLTEGAIHFWSDSRGTLVENNTIINCDRGIMFGLSSSGHFDGIIRNNFIVVNEDVGIYLAHAQNTKVYNNTVYLNSGYRNAIEYRFDDCKNNDIRNNLCNGVIKSRDGGQADLSTNVTSAQKSWFKNILAGDLHLVSAVDVVVDKGESVGITVDIDGDSRSDGKCDIGADEL